MKTLAKLKILYELGCDRRYPKIFSFHDSLPDVFSNALELLIYKRYRILGASELLERLSFKSIWKTELGRRKEAFLTFDDGRRNCWTVIFPLLKKYKVRASFFIIPSRIKETSEYYPNLEDYWSGKVPWENLYLSHRRQPYLTWRELELMQSSGLVDVFSHSLKHDIVPVSSSVIDFQHPGVYEMPVYFDEWFQAGGPQLDSLWGVPIYERGWAPLFSNAYVPEREADLLMNEFVRSNGGFLFFKKKNWRKRLLQHYLEHKRDFPRGHYEKLKNREDAHQSVFESKKIIEDRLKSSCDFLSLPLYQNNSELMNLIREANYRVVLSGPDEAGVKRKFPIVLKRIPGFWIKFLAYL